MARTAADPGTGGAGRGHREAAADRDAVGAHGSGHGRPRDRSGGTLQRVEGDEIAVHPPSTEDARGPCEAIGSDQAGPRHPADSA